jgi:hypothetical protein
VNKGPTKSIPTGLLDDQNNNQSEKEASNKKLAFLFVRNFCNSLQANRYFGPIHG